jgi:hypothetical protein
LTSTPAAELAEELLHQMSNPTVECALVSLTTTVSQGLMCANQERFPDEISTTFAAHLARDLKISVPRRISSLASGTLHSVLRA